MYIRTCIKCGRLFHNFPDSPVCQQCWLESDQKIQEVEEYVSENQQAEIQEVARDCHVKEDQLQRWLKTDQLHFPDFSSLKVPCENCGALIHSGTLCENCKNIKRNVLQNLSEELSPPRKNMDKPQKPKRPRSQMFTANRKIQY